MVDLERFELSSHPHSLECNTTIYTIILIEVNSVFARLRLGG